MTIKLSSYSKGGGCGCKMSPEVLESILKHTPKNFIKGLLVGNSSKDDAAVYELDNEQCLISTTDFFLPIVDDAFDFGRIAAANAISDVYAMGGKPVMALAILGWPTDIIPIEEAQQVMKGAQTICELAGIPIAGGHSINTSEPIFGLCVTGLVKKEHLKLNNTCKEGDYLYLTKPLGIGLMANAMKHGKLSEDGYKRLIELTTTLNTSGEELGKLKHVTALTDVTGFGLLGHLSEMLGEDLGATLYLNKIPVEPEAKHLAEQLLYPNITTNNYNFIKDRTLGLKGLEFLWLCDPQTSGGLLFTSTIEMEMKNCFLIGKINEGKVIKIV